MGSSSAKAAKTHSRAAEAAAEEALTAAAEAELKIIYSVWIIYKQN